ncbi:MAG: signal peptidase II [Acidobacteriia bacterium]|nr:signal peptidase II [Terriglobia bacterium]
MRSLYLLISVAVVVFDQWTKALVVRDMSLGESVPVIRNFVHLTFSRNPGIAFGFFGLNPGPYQNWILSALSLLAIVVVVLLMRRYPVHRFGMQTAMALIIGGAAGNLWDRLRLGEVTDFIDVFYRDHHWPVFNVADSAITIGVILMAIGLIFFDSAENQEPSHSSG